MTSPLPKDTLSRDRTLASRLGWNSLLGRYLYLASALVGALLVTAWFAHRHVTATSGTNLANLDDRRTVAQRLSTISNALWRAEGSLQSYLLAPSNASRERTLSLLHEVRQELQPLQSSAWLQTAPAARDITNRLDSDLAELSVVLVDLMRMREDPELLYPAMPIMVGRMLPSASSFYTYATLAIDEAREFIAKPHQSEVHRLFTEARHTQTLMIGAFRLWVANRSGVFGEIDSSMRAQAQNIELHAERVESLLAAIGRLDAQDRLQFQQSESYLRMREAQSEWRKNYKAISPIYMSDRWRADAPLLRDRVQPLFAKVGERLRGLDREIEQRSTNDMGTTMALADRMSDSLWLLVVAGLVIAAMGVVIFERHIRRPLARIGDALLAEATGGTVAPLPPVGTKETQRLVDAFTHMRHEVRHRQERLQAVLTYAAEAIVTVDERGVVESFNPAAEALFGYRASEVIGKSAGWLAPPPHREAHDDFVHRYLATGEGRIIGRPREVDAAHKDGSLIPISLNVSEMHVGNQRLFLAVMSDNRERKALIEEIRSRQENLRAILDNTAEGIITFDPQGHIETWNQAAEHLFGWAEGEVLGTSIARLISPESRETRDSYLDHFLRHEIERLVGHEGETEGRHKNGHNFPLSLKISEFAAESGTRYIALLANIAERKAMMEHLKRLAEHDGLTGLFNRTYFLDELTRTVERVRRNPHVTGALLYIDLDNFKYVNDTLGHAAGDRLLAEVAAILTRRARKTDVIARLGGDEFVILAHDAALAAAVELAESLRQQLAGYEFRFEGQLATIGCSIGLVPIHHRTPSGAEAMSHADLSCHLAKRSGRNRVHVYTDDDGRNAANHSLDMGWARRIRTALERNRFVLAGQPIVHTVTREIEAHEVLVRLREDNGELIMPSGFLPSAERFGLASDIDLWVVGHAMELLAERRRHDPALRFAVNLSAQTLTLSALVGLVRQQLERLLLDPGALTFEITETTAIADMNTAVTLLNELRGLGCRTALDDFGSGMSSFSYLRDLPVDVVKIDGRFVQHLTTSDVDRAMVRAMNEVAHALGKKTIAEYVENEDHFRLLGEIGIDYGQGYHLGQPQLLVPTATPAASAAAG